MNGDKYKTMSTIDILFLIAELEHMRRHAILAAASDEEDNFQYLVLASQCQKTRRDIQKKYFSNVKTKDWCIVKSSARLLQLTEELANGDLEEISSLKRIVDEAINISTGEDISMCESCKKDKEEVE